MDEKELLKMAKGGNDPDKVVGRDKAKLLHKSRIQEVPDNRKRMLLKRRDIRRGVFEIRKRIRQDRADSLPAPLEALKEIIEAQLNPNLGLRWETFSHTWDIHPTNPSLIVTEEKWFQEGGSVDAEFGNVKDPTAFTKQD